MLVDSGEEDGPLEGMVEWLISNAETPPKEVKGVSQGFLDGEWGFFLFLLFFFLVWFGYI